MLQMSNNYYWNGFGYSPWPLHLDSEQGRSVPDVREQAALQGSFDTSVRLTHQEQAQQPAQLACTTSSSHLPSPSCSRRLPTTPSSPLEALSQTNRGQLSPQQTNYLLQANSLYRGLQAEGLNPYLTPLQSQGFLYNQALLSEMKTMGMDPQNQTNLQYWDLTQRASLVGTKRAGLNGAVFPSLLSGMAGQQNIETERMRKDRARDAAVEKFLCTLPSRRKKRFKYSSSPTGDAAALRSKPPLTTTMPTVDAAETNTPYCHPSTEIEARKEQSSECPDESKLHKKVKKPASRQSKYRGVCWNKSNSSWKACLKVKGKNVHIGYFDDEVDAARAYDVKAYSIRGQEAKLNFPRPDGHFG